MPGSIYDCIAPAAPRFTRFTPASAFCLEHGAEWHYEQRVFPTCQIIESRAIGCCLTKPVLCEVCHTMLEPWAGRVWFDRVADRGPVERVEGPCPHCGGTLTKNDSHMFGLWD
jgi:hypothetical protein